MWRDEKKIAAATARTMTAPITIGRRDDPDDVATTGSGGTSRGGRDGGRRGRSLDARVDWRGLGLGLLEGDATRIAELAQVGRARLDERMIARRTRPSRSRTTSDSTTPPPPAGSGARRQSRGCSACWRPRGSRLRASAPATRPRGEALPPPRRSRRGAQPVRPGPSTPGCRRRLSRMCLERCRLHYTRAAQYSLGNRWPRSPGSRPVRRSARTRSSRCSARAGWARSTRATTRGSAVTSRSRCSSASSRRLPTASAGSSSKPVRPRPSATPTSSRFTTSAQKATCPTSSRSSSRDRRCGNCSPLDRSRCGRRSISRSRSPAACRRRTRAGSCIATSSPRTSS